MDTLIFVPVLLILSIAVMADEDPEPFLDDFLVYPMSPRANIRKRDTGSTQNKEMTEKLEAKEKRDRNFETFTLGQLLQQNQALENMLAKITENEEITKRLIENFGKQPQHPRLPEKFEMPVPDKDADVDNAVVKLGKSLPKYGNLVKNMIVNNVREDPEPVALVEHDPKSNSSLSKAARPSRRSFGGDAGPEIDVPQGVSPWCLVATLCKKSAIPICGFDERFGYGKFDDFCHMLQVNCYYKYNFAVVAHCRPFLSNK